jgi:hypothetical protein
VFGTEDLREREIKEREIWKKWVTSPVWHREEIQEREQKFVGPTTFLFLFSGAKKAKRDDQNFTFSIYTLVFIVPLFALNFCTVTKLNLYPLPDPVTETQKTTIITSPSSCPFPTIVILFSLDSCSGSCSNVVSFHYVY